MTPYMNMILPIPHVTSGTWGDELNTAFLIIDSHDHASGRGAPLSLSAMGLLSTTAPVDVTDGVAAVGISVLAARADHAHHIADASAISAGIITTSSQTFAGKKTFQDGIAYNLVIGTSSTDCLVLGGTTRMQLTCPAGTNGLRVDASGGPLQLIAQDSLGVSTGANIVITGTGANGTQSFSASAATATAIDQLRDSPSFSFSSKYWTGTASAVSHQGVLGATVYSTSAPRGGVRLRVSTTDVGAYYIRTDGLVGIGIKDASLIAGLHYLCGVADGASAIAELTDTSTAWSTVGAKLKSWRNNSVEQLFIDMNGAIGLVGISTGAAVTTGAYQDSSNNLVLKDAIAGTRTLAQLAHTLFVTTYSPSITINASLGGTTIITVNDGVAFTLNAPSNPSTGNLLIIRIKNTHTAALGTVTWDAVFKMASWTSPAPGYSRTIIFQYDGTNWIEASRTPADVPN